ncbi:MAG TPA: ATP-dependent RNA helicase HrpA [Gammaproteobacteria bacterium]|nr:ATP-dependent RNA helicase HrpA [Gammaproteobacteria bacterium]
MLRSLEAQLPGCMSAERAALAGRIARLRSAVAPLRPGELEALCSALDTSCARREQRRRQLPVPSYPDALPVTRHRDELLRVIDAHPVVVVAGATGSGKTTQLPKLCLELGRGVAGMIGHTQPRRIAARSVAARIAAELHGEVGHAVGFQVRFSDRLGPDTYIKLMTDGILLAETQQDPLLARYDTLIIDEAHERSLNVDFLLGYVQRLLQRRNDLKVIITSATIDTERFARHFGGAPVVEVSGRNHPVEIRYRPLATEDPDTEDRDLTQGILEAVDELCRVGPGDVLVFLPGEREIRAAAEALRKHHPPQTEILPLYARLSVADQNRVFETHPRRRIVLATNVAETSLTVPGIGFVVDPGLVRISRYSHHARIQRLPVEKVSRASADQRAGRCGRTGPGVCVRLYDEADYCARPEFTDPEIRRTNLAAVVLRMKALGLGDPQRFPFLDPPEPRRIRDGVGQLRELGALDERDRLTEIGRALARLPVDPRIGRMVLAAHERQCVEEVLIIASALAVQDPRERPLDRQQAADEAHRVFQDPRSDFLAFLNLWRAYHQQARLLSQNRLRRWCVARYVSYLRMREWHDIHRQLAVLVKDMRFTPNVTPADYEAIHRALLAGLLSHIGFQDDPPTYAGARNTRFTLFPGSALFRKPPKWVMAAERVETRRLYARTVAVIDPAWAEPLAAHLVKRHYADPHWEARAGRVIAYERVTLYGLPIVARRKVDYGTVDPAEARAVFIREALVRGDYRGGAPFLEHNRGLVAELEALEAKVRRRDVLAEEDTVFEFYAARIPDTVNAAVAFERWRRDVERDDPRGLFLTRAVLTQSGAEPATGERFPDLLEVGALRIPLRYRFEPGAEDDGITARVPAAALNQLDPARLEWLVPGLLHEKLVQLIKTLPKSLRRHFVPAPDFARACAQAMAFGSGGLIDALTAHLHRMTGVAVAPNAWRPDALPAHLRMRVVVVDEHGTPLADDRDVAELQGRLGGEAARRFARLPTTGLERDALTTWDVGDLPEQVEVCHGGVAFHGYPALVDEGGQVALRVLDSAERAAPAHRGGVRRLLRNELHRELRTLTRQLPGFEPLRLRYTALGDLAEELVTALLDRLLFADGDPMRQAAVYGQRRDAARAGLYPAALELCAMLKPVFEAHAAVLARLSSAVPPAHLGVYRDVREQIDALVYPGFVSRTPADRLSELPRYLRAAELRLEKLHQAPQRDRQRAAQLAPHWGRYRERVERQGGAGRDDPQLSALRWLLEEYRVSLFAQELGTAQPVSEKRLAEQWSKLPP